MESLKDEDKDKFRDVTAKTRFLRSTEDDFKDIDTKKLEVFFSITVSFRCSGVFREYLNDLTTQISPTKLLTSLRLNLKYQLRG